MTAAKTAIEELMSSLSGLRQLVSDFRRRFCVSRYAFICSFPRKQYRHTKSLTIPVTTASISLQRRGTAFTSRRSMLYWGRLSLPLKCRRQYQTARLITSVATSFYRHPATTSPSSIYARAQPDYRSAVSPTSRRFHYSFHHHRHQLMLHR